MEISFEFFPPRNEAQERRFWYTLGNLQVLDPSYISMTWGALGSACQPSIDILTHLIQDYPTPVTAHLSCAGQTCSQMRQTIDVLTTLGVTRFLALRGDRPEKHASAPPTKEPQLAHACDLVTLLAEDSNRQISVAAYPESHPESSSQQDDLYWLKHKLDAGASRAISQFFFEADTFLRFRDKAQAIGISATLVPGILPVHDISKVIDFSDKCGANVPVQLVEGFAKATTASSRFAAAVEHSVELCHTLRREGVGEFHFYTLNQSPLTQAVVSELQGQKQPKKIPEAA